MPILDKAIPTKNEKEWKEYKEGWRNSAFSFLTRKRIFLKHSYRKTHISFYTLD